MSNKISISIIITQAIIIILGILFFLTNILPDIKNRGVEKYISLANGKEWKACLVEVNDSEVKRIIARNRYIISKDGNCPISPNSINLTKSQYINELQNSKGWGIFDDDFVYPDLIKPDIPK